MNKDYAESSFGKLMRTDSPMEAIPCKTLRTRRCSLIDLECDELPTKVAYTPSLHRYEKIPSCFVEKYRPALFTRVRVWDESPSF